VYSTTVDNGTSWANGQVGKHALEQMKHIRDRTGRRLPVGYSLSSDAKQAMGEVKETGRQFSGYIDLTIAFIFHLVQTGHVRGGLL
jgi:hypothetical protein